MFLPAVHTAAAPICFKVYSSRIDSALQNEQNWKVFKITIRKMDKIGKYKIVRVLGSGATSTVYLAIDPFNKERVAIKLFDLGMLRDPDRAKLYRKLLMTEASLAGKLSHPHIAKILDAVMDDEVNYVVMEYVEGTTLEQYAEVDTLLPINTIAEIIYKCCKALEYAQQQGVIHRDIKPANILMRGESEIKISDFGSAAVQSQQSTQVSGVGSPAYMSPEQVKELKLTHQTDIYSLGVVMYKLLTGKLPFDASNNASMIYHIINIDPPPPSSFRPETPQELDHIVLRAMEKDTVKRYQTWDEFANDLVGFTSHSAPTQKEILDTEKFDTLRSLAFFKNFSDVELWEVLRISEWRKVLESEYILHEDESGRSFYVLAQGTVRVSKQGRLLSLLHRGDCFGEMAHLLERDFKRSTDVIAKNDVVLIEINPDVLMHATSGCRLQFGDAFLRMLVKRLSLANTRISHLLADHDLREVEQDA
jgi:serine/threonine protein kinase